MRYRILSLPVLISLMSSVAGLTDDLNMKSKPLENPSVPPPPSWSRLRSFEHGAVCSDSNICSTIGRDILAKNGSAVDSAIAAMICSGVVNLQAMGIGGGFIMIVYIKEEGKAYTVMARETAPAAATPNMYKGNFKDALIGSLSTGVPGEVMGMWQAHKRWGRLPWKSLFTPTLKLFETGFPMGIATRATINNVPYIKDDMHLRNQYFDEAKNEFREQGSIVKPTKELYKTLNRIAQKGGDEFYKGSLATDILNDLKRIGSIITAEDLQNYQAKIEESINVPFGDNGDVLITSPPPSSGVILINILNILREYNFTADSIMTLDDEILTYHRVLEAFKYSYSLKTKLGDKDYFDLSQLIKNATSPDFGEKIRKRINDATTSNNTADYDVDYYGSEDGGTSHLSILSPEGDAVSVTSSVNNYFGAGYTTLNTGIVMNDIMDDFSSQGFFNSDGVKPSPFNVIQPGKRPVSSMAPSIIVDKTGKIKMIVGAAGGTKITSTVALVIMRKLWFGQSLKEAVDAPRIHHQMFPMNAQYEDGITQNVIDGLKSKGHEMKRFQYSSGACAINRDDTGIYANADYRRGGDTDGL